MTFAFVSCRVPSCCLFGFANAEHLMPKLNEETLDELSQLCRIRCSKKTKEKLIKNLNDILSYVDLFNEIDTKEVVVCDHVGTVQGVNREDKTEKTLEREAFLSNSPSHVGGMVRVPPIINF